MRATVAAPSAPGTGARRAPRRAPGETRREWLALGPASRLLGVDPDTLRRWADSGRLEAFVTPGGHRRFLRRELERLIAAGRRARPPMARLGGTQEHFSAIYRRRYGSPQGGADARAVVPDADREAFREDGRRLVAALLRHLDVVDAGVRETVEAEAAAATTDLGRRLAVGGLELVPAVRLFVASRRPFLGELGALARRRALAAGQLSELYETASGLLDRLLLAFIDGYQAGAIGSLSPTATARSTDR